MYRQIILLELLQKQNKEGLTYISRRKPELIIGGITSDPYVSMAHVCTAACKGVAVDVEMSRRLFLEKPGRGSEQPSRSREMQQRNASAQWIHKERSASLWAKDT